MKLSIVIPSYNVNSDIERLTIEALESYKPQTKELIVVEDGGSYNSKIRELADIYCFNSTNHGFTFAVNQGIKLSTLDYIAVVNSDTQLERGNLEDLCIKDTATSPEIITQSGISGLSGSFFTIPRSVLDKIGLLDERLKVYYSDTEYIDRLKENKIEMKTIEDVRVFHYIAQTVSVTKHLGDKDKDVYEEISSN